MKNLITGGAGFIGSYLAETLLARGEEVTIIDDLSTGDIRNILHLESNPKFTAVIDTIMKESLVEELVKECDLVYHLAAAVGVKFIVEKPLESIQINVKGTEIILEAANRRRKKVIIASTSEIYGKGEKDAFSENDDMTLGPTTSHRWSYALSKGLDEILALTYYREKSLPVVIARFFNTCGPRQRGRYGMVIPRFVQQALTEQPITVYGTGKQKRCFAYVGDVVEALITLAHKPEAQGEIFNIGNDEEISIEDLARLVKELTGSPSPIAYIPYDDAYEHGFEDMIKRAPDLTKIRKLIGYSPKVHLKELLERVIEYYRAQGLGQPGQGELL